MGANPNIPPGQQYEGIGMPVQITDHSKDKATQCNARNRIMLKSNVLTTNSKSENRWAASSRRLTNVSRLHMAQ